MHRLSALVLFTLFAVPLHAADIVVAEGESFTPRDAKGWKVTHQDDSYASHTYGGMWSSQGGLLGAPADSDGSVATRAVSIPKAGSYRVWSKYQAPPYFNYLHKIEIVQNGKIAYSHVYGKKGTPRLWSFSGVSDELWWPWGVDHDAAEAPAQLAALAAGPAELRLVTVANAKPAGNRYVDFVVLTTNPGDDYQGFKPYAVGSPFTNEAFAATKLYLRFKNMTAAPARLSVIKEIGRYQPQYGGATLQVPEKPVAAGQWSEWVNIGPFCKLVHNEGLKLVLSGAGEIPVQIARDAAGKDVAGDLVVKSGDAALIPKEVVWRKEAVIKTNRAHAADMIAQSKKWRTANGGKKPREIRFYGGFAGKDDWVMAFKDMLGYNTLLPAQYDQIKRTFIPQHYGTPDAIRKLAAGMKPDERQSVGVISFGDEIGLGEVNYADPALRPKFAAWLKGRGVTAKDLGADPATAVPAKTGTARLAWYSNLFSEEERFAEFRATTAVARQVFGADVLTGANYSPHTLALCYGPIYQWVDLFKHNGMSMFWAEDYIFSVPEAPQILSWMLGEIRCGVKYHGQPIHMYIMPHAPGQEPAYLRRNTLLSVGSGAQHIDNFGVAPEERMTENYVAWTEPGTFRAIHEAIYDTAEAEPLHTGGKVRPARVALVIGKATDFNESKRMVDKAQDAFTRQCKNAPDKVNQILCRKDQQMLYLALRHAQHAVELITEDDVVELDALKNYDVVYFAGEWIDHRIVPRLDAWVKAGGVLYATAGVGHRNEFDEPQPAMLTLLGLKETKESRNVAVLRTLLELPLLEPMDTITFDGGKVAAAGLKQVLTPATAKVLGTWSDGSAAVTVQEQGKGKAFAVGTLAGNSYMKTGLRVTPWARGGRGTLYNPVDFDPTATKLVRLGVDAAKPVQAVVCGDPGAEAVVLDGPKGTLLTLVNWTNAPLKDLTVRVRLPAKPKDVRSVGGQKTLASEYADGVLSFTIDLADADYVLLPK